MAGLMLVQGLLMMLLPVGVILWLVRRRKVSWLALGVGAGMFILAQVPKSIEVLLIKPQNTWVLILFLASVPGLWEEVLKWGPMKLLRLRNWQAVLDFGLGFGAIEAILMGVQVLIIGLLLMVDPDASMLPPDAREQLLGISLGAGLLTLFLSVIERAGAMAAHIGFAFLNGQALKAGRWYYVLIAIAGHSLLDLPPSILAILGGKTTFTIVLVEAFVVAWAAVSLWYVNRTLRSEGELEAPFAPVK